MAATAAPIPTPTKNLDLFRTILNNPFYLLILGLYIHSGG